MYPWWWFWAPQVHFPLSGSVAQQIEPNTNWFFGSIRPEAGIGDVEQEIFENVASYGRQLGLITEVLLNGVDGTVDDSTASRSLARLKEIREKTEAVKAESSDRLASAAGALLERLRASDPKRFEEVLQQFGSRRN
jgi:hypothetical protein